MKTLIRIALILTVAAVAGLTPAAHAQAEEPDPLDTAQGKWYGNTEGTEFTEFSAGRPVYSFLYGWYTPYKAVHTHKDGVTMTVEAYYWHHEKYKGLVTFTYNHNRGQDYGSGEWILQFGSTADGTKYRMLIGKWSSKKWNASGNWTLWRRHVELPR